MENNFENQMFFLENSFSTAIFFPDFPWIFMQNFSLTFHDSLCKRYFVPWLSIPYNASRNIIKWIIIIYNIKCLMFGPIFLAGKNTNQWRIQTKFGHSGFRKTVRCLGGIGGGEVLWAPSGSRAEHWWGSRKLHCFSYSKYFLYLNLIIYMTLIIQYL